MSDNPTERQKEEEAKNDPNASSKDSAGIWFWVGAVIGLLLIVIITEILFKWLSMLSTGH